MESSGNATASGHTRINVEPNESLSERIARRRSNGNRNDGAVRIWVDECRNLRCKKQKKKMCARVSDGQTESDHYFSRSNLKWVERESMKKGGQFVKTVKIKNKGRVRTVVVVKHDETAQSSVEGNGNAEVEEVEVVSSVALDNGSSEHCIKRNRRTGTGPHGLHGIRKNTEGRREDGKKALKRRRRRKIVTVSEFQLFKEGEMISRKNVRGGRGDISDEVKSGESEKDKFNKSIELCLGCTTNLGDRWEDAPYFRCSGGRRRNQKFICVGTLRTKRYVGNGKCVVSVLMSIVVEEQSRKLRNLVVKREKHMFQSGIVLQDDVTNFCSCDVNWMANGIVNSSCWHVKCMTGNEQFMKQVHNIIEFGFQQDHSMYYGDFIIVRESDGGKAVTTCGNGGRESSLDRDEHGETGLLAIQLDTINARDLTEKGNRIAKKWSAWCVVDIYESMLVTVVWRATNNRTNATRMECVMCRTELSRKCRHEVVCEAESKIERAVSGDEYSDGESDANPAHPDVEDGCSNGGMDVVDSVHVNDNSNELSESVREAARPAESGRSDKDEDKERIDFFPKNYKRSFMMCSSERRLAQLLCDLIETCTSGSGSLMFGDPEGVQCEGVIRGRRRGDVRCDGTRVKSCRDVPRRVTLYTLHHDDMTVVLRDWICETCGHYNVYRGTSHGIYPSEAGIAYSVELMYTWIYEMCSSTKSFRNVYASIRKVQFSASYKRRFDTGRVKKLSGSRMHNRRNANTAIRNFIKSIDMDGDIASGQLFSCPKCEIDMEESDFQQLGIDPQQYRGVKRLKSVVIDAKVVALLKDGREATDRHEILHSVSGVRNRIINNRITQNAIRLFVKMVKRSMSWRRDAAASLRCNSDAQKMEDGSFVYQDHLFLRLGGMARHTTTKSQSERNKLVEFVGIIRWYLDPTICMCRGDKRTSLTNHNECIEVRKRLDGTGGKEFARTVLSSVFENVEHSTIAGIMCNVDMTESAPGAVAGMSTVSEENEEDMQQSEGEDILLAQSSTGGNESKYGKGDLGVDDSWIRMKFSNFTSTQDLLDSALELISFCFVEPITLGYFPFQTQNGVYSDDAAANAQDSARNEVDEGHDGAGVNADRTVQREGRSAEIEDNEHRVEQRGYINGEESDNGHEALSRQLEQQVDGAAGNAVNEMDDTSSAVGDITSHVGTVLDDNLNGENENAPNERTRMEGVNGSTSFMRNEINEESSDAEVRAEVKQLASESVSLHRKVATAMHEAYSCKHGNRTITDWVCKKCLTKLGNYNNVVMLQNCVLGKFVRDFMRFGRLHPVFSRLIASTLSNLIDIRTDHMEKYMESIADRLPVSSVRYWKKFGCIAPRSLRSDNDDNSPKQPDDSLYTFPGRHRCREGIDFEKVDRQECTKNYFKGHSVVPSFLTVQCACAHPKLIGFVVLRECESISAALSSVLTHFPVPPRTVWYDNACNSYDCAMIRIPWLLRWSMLIVDRFHFTGHNCSNFFNGNLHRILDDDRSVAAEVINAVIDKCTSHINYLEGRNVVPFMKVLFGHLNATAYARDRTGKGDLEDEDLGQLFRDMFLCPCDLCSAERDYDRSALSTDIDVVEGISIFNDSNIEAIIEYE